jgi:hypothetical protein
MYQGFEGIFCTLKVEERTLFNEKRIIFVLEKKNLRPFFVHV